MLVLFIMCLGILAGRFIVPQKAKKGCDFISLTCTFLLILSMGIRLGSNDAFFSELSSLGLSSFVLFFFPTLFSIIIVYVLTKKFMGDDKKDGDE